MVDETRHSGGVGEGVVTALVEAGFTGPIQRVASQDSFVPLGAAAEHVLLSEDEIEKAGASAAGRRWDKSMTGTGPLELLGIDHLLSDDERDIQATVREFVDQRVKPNIADWFERGDLDLGLMREAGALGLLGMHLEGYGCAGTNAVSYGLACLELEAGDSGVRSMVSVQGSLAMFAIWKFGQRGAEADLAAPDGRRRGDRLLRADRARLRLQPGGHADARQAGRRRLGAQRHQDVDHQRLGRRRRRGLGADRRRASGASWSRPTPRASPPQDHQEAVAARLGHLRAGARGRPPAAPTRCFREVTGLAGRCPA